MLFLKFKTLKIMTKPIQTRSIELAAVNFYPNAIYVDFSVDGFGAHAEFPYGKYIEWLHDHPDGPTFEARIENSRPRISKRGKYSADDECRILQEVTYCDGDYDVIPLLRSLKEVAEDWADTPWGYVVEYDVPEPATLSLLAAGIMGLVMKRRSRR